MNKHPIAILIVWFFSFVSKSYALDLSVLREGFQKVQTHTSVTNLPKGIAYLSDPSQLKESDIEEMLPQSYARLNYNSIKDNELSRLMEALFLDVVQTPTGSKICKEASHGQPEIISNIFGVSYQLAKSISNCGHSVANWPDIWIRSSATKRRFVFILHHTNEAKIQAQGWTTKEGITYFFLKPNNLNEKDLVRLYVHELAMYVLGDSEVSQSTGGLKFYFLNRPIMNQALKLTKAYQIEKQILKEIGINDSDSDSNASCSEKVKSALAEVIPYSKFFKFEEIVFYQNNFQFLEPLQDDIKTPEDLDPQVGAQILESDSNLCQSSLRFNFNNVIDGLGPRGPRPNTGNGTGLDTKMTSAPSTSRPVLTNSNPLLKYRNQSTEISVSNQDSAKAETDAATIQKRNEIARKALIEALRQKDTP